MQNKESILDDVKQYTADQLVDFIRKGIVTFEELCNDTNGEFSPAKRHGVEEKLKCVDEDEEEWAKVIKENSIDAFNRYLQRFPNGKHRIEARKRKTQLEEKQSVGNISIDNDPWSLVDKSDLASLREFVDKYPHSEHTTEANSLIDTLSFDEIMGVNAGSLVSQIRQIQTDHNLTVAQKDNNIIDEIKRYLSDKKITKVEFLEEIKKDHNLLSAGVVKRLINNGTISTDDLLKIHIDKQFIQKMFKGESAETFVTPEKLDRIHKQSTEIYFWGIPSSGKSCALGAILSVAASGRVAYSMDADTDSQGYGYMMKLRNLFQPGEVGTLMEGTSVDSFYEMGFDLIDNEKKIHPITCIDMAGELMRCMFKYDAGETLNDTEVDMLDTMTKVLGDNRSTNRKMHVFVIEYGAEDRKYEGLPQKIYLEGALSYIKKTGIFRKDTDAIYIMITKADKVKNSSKDTFTNYINDNYLGFYNGLERICRENEINGGKVEKIAFSLGDVCFQNYCRFDSKPAENVVRLILDRSASSRGGKRGWLGKILRD